MLWVIWLMLVFERSRSSRIRDINRPEMTLRVYFILFFMSCLFYGINPNHSKRSLSVALTRSVPLPITLMHALFSLITAGLSAFSM